MIVKIDARRETKLNLPAQLHRGCRREEDDGVPHVGVELESHHILVIRGEPLIDDDWHSRDVSLCVAIVVTHEPGDSIRQRQASDCPIGTDRPRRIQQGVRGFHRTTQIDQRCGSSLKVSCPEPRVSQAGVRERSILKGSRNEVGRRQIRIDEISAEELRGSQIRTA